jgi:endonuclease III
MAAINWTKEFKPLIKKYKNKPHPLEFKNPYQLVIMVVLAAQDSDRNINKVTLPLFAKFPTFETLAKADYDTILPFLSSVRGGRKKTKWILDIAKAIKIERNIPRTMDALSELSGIGRKSASVIMKELGAPAEGIIVDLHVVRVAPRLGVTKESDPKKIEKDLMAAVEKKDWGEVGMAISHLGREICRPTDPKHELCVMNEVCAYCNGDSMLATKVKPATEKPKAVKGKKK